MGNLKRNPKRSKEETYNNKEEPLPPKKYVYHKSRTSIWMVLVFLAISGILIITIFITFTPRETETIEKYDLVLLNYSIWAEENHDYNYSNPVIEIYNATLNVSSRYNENAQDGLILGFYNELLGKSVGYGRTFNINATVDLDKDGIDDLTNMDALGYGFLEDGLLYNTTIIINYKILAIQKPNATIT